MNVSKVPMAEAFSSGADMWVIGNQNHLNWWQELDLRSCFLLTKATEHRKKTVAPELQTIVKATGLSPIPSPLKADPDLLLGTENFFFNRWILLIQPTADAEPIISLAQSLRAKELRFFSHRHLAEKISTRPMASSLNISFIENI